jgi:transketolase C-terminal domain/subunit
MIGVGSGVSYESMGKTHFNMDDINLLYTFKNIIILNPANLDELKFVYKKYFNYQGPLYFRINKFSYKNIFKLKRKNNYFIKKGNKNNIICSGAILNYIGDIFNKNEIKELNIISIPILNSNIIKNIRKHIVKGKIIIICDCNESAIFKDVEKSLFGKNCLYIKLNSEKIKKVDNELGILKQAGFSKTKIKKFLIDKKKY